MRACRYSVPAALSRGLQVGLPLAAILAATVPVWGMSWHFDTENWAAGIWNSWAESRTDTWREAMVRCGARIRRADAPDRRDLRGAAAEGVSGDFSFIVIGDTGEGRRVAARAARPAARRSSNQPDVRFVVISSGRRLSHRRDARLRGEVLAAVQGRPQTGLRHSRQSRLGTTRSRRSTSTFFRPTPRAPACERGSRPIFA